VRAFPAGSVPQPWKAQLERKLAQGAGLALSDCFVSLRAMCVLYFGISALLLASMPIDWLCGTSLTGIWADRYIEIKLTELAAALLWCIFFLAPAVVSRSANGSASHREQTNCPRRDWRVALDWISTKPTLKFVGR
jgi:hypothetical protein